MIRLSVIFGFVLICFNSFADTTFNFKMHQHFITPRALGMGNTFMGVDDYSAVFYNPAALADLKEGELNMAIQGGTSFQTINFGSDLDKASKVSGGIPNQLNSISNVLLSNYAQALNFRFPNLQGIWVRPGWGLAIIPVDLSATFIPHQLGGPGLDLTAYQDTTIAYSWAKKFGEYFSAGVTGKLIYRANVNKGVIMSDLVGNGQPIQMSDFKEGLTADADVAAQYKIPIDEATNILRFAKPTVGIVIRNIADYGYFRSFNLISKQSGSPEKMYRRVDLGSRWDLPNFWVFTPRLMIEQRDILHPYYTFLKGLHIGGELLWKVGSALKGSYQLGFSQGYITAGVSLQLSVFALDVATYAEEVGTSNATSADRQYMVKMSLNF